jgi:energy-converting hydrogenase Eha subunit B
VPGPVNVKVVVLIVAAFIAWLKVAVTTVLGQTPTAPFAGVSETTIGGTQATAAVVKLHATFFASAFPNASFAPVLTVAVYRVLTARLLAGVKVAVSLAES